MVMTDERDMDTLLEPFFAAARRADPEPSADMMRAVLAASARPASTPKWRFQLPRLLAGAGFWGALGGMATAAAVGVWLGFVGSEQVMRVATGFDETDTMALLADSDILALASE